MQTDVVGSLGQKSHSFLQFERNLNFLGIQAMAGPPSW